VVARAEAAFGVELPLRAIFDAPTVAGLAERIAAIRGSGPGPRAHTVERVAREGALAPSFGQERFWFLRKLIPDLAAYHVPLAYALHGALDADALDRALAEVVRRHEVLRTRLAEREGRPVQEILPAAAVPLVRIDLRHDPAALQGALEEEAARAFDFAAEPPVRLRLWRTGEEDHVLLVCVHHVATDGWSTGVLLRELAALYAAFAEGRPSPLPDLPVQYADYAAWQRAHASGDRLRGQLAYWRERLDGLAPLQLATDRPRPPVQGFRGGIVRLALEPDASRRLHELAGREGATLYMVLLAAWQALLAAHSGSDDVAVATPVAGRSRPELEGLIGFFVNTLVLRTGLGGDPTFRELLARAREAALGAFQHQDVPFERLVEELQVERHPDRSPLAQVMFALQNLPPAPHDLAGVALRPLPTRTAATQFDLSLAAAERAGALDLVLEFNVELFDAPTAERILERYARLLAQVAAEPGRRLSRIDWLSAEERAWVLAAGSPFAAEFAAEPSVPERIAER
ncbi:MAG TPA: condensation domain-containing protein, partial [Longimicrobium sp.]|nr:condensation domain-containing protein [Longimicrobium sp.]